MNGERARTSLKGTQKLHTLDDHSNAEKHFKRFVILLQNKAGKTSFWQGILVLHTLSQHQLFYRCDMKSSAHPTGVLEQLQF